MIRTPPSNVKALAVPLEHESLDPSCLHKKKPYLSRGRLTCHNKTHMDNSNHTGGQMDHKRHWEKLYQTQTYVSTKQVFKYSMNSHMPENSRCAGLNSIQQSTPISLVLLVVTFPCFLLLFHYAFCGGCIVSPSIPSPKRHDKVEP